MAVDLYPPVSSEQMGYKILKTGICRLEITVGKEQRKVSNH